MKNSSPSSSFHFGSNDPAAAAGCLPGILRRFPCGSLRSRNSGEGEGGEADEIDAAFGQEFKFEAQKTMPSPGIVARLMGLESMPVHPSELIGRTRSTNSLESWPGFLSERCQSPQVRTSVSFREVPTYLRQENEDFLLLNFASDDREEKMASNGMRRGKGFREMKERKSEDMDRNEEKKKKKKNKRDEHHQHCHKKDAPQKNQDEVMVSSICSRKKDVRGKVCRGSKADDLIKPMKRIEMPIMLDKSGVAKKKLENAREKVEQECSSQDSSPVSVLDLAYNDDDCCINTKSPSPDEEKQTKQQSSRKKLSSNFENANGLSPNIGLVTFSRDGGMSSLDKECKIPRKPERPCSNLLDIWGNICGLAEEDLKNSAWISKEMRRSEGVANIAADLGLEILDLLLCEAACEFSNSTVL